MTSTHRVFGTTTLVAALAFGSPGAAQVTGFPDADETSGRFVSLVRGFETLGLGQVSIALDIQSDRLEVGVFDGDLGGKWDALVPGEAVPGSTLFAIFADPQAQGSTAELVKQWDAADMPDGQWFAIVLDHAAAARAANGHHVYNLVASFTQPTQGRAQNNFKVRANGRVYGRAGETFGLIGYAPNDPAPTTFAPSSYDGLWRFAFAPPTGATVIELWNGDLDLADDDDDANTPPIPPFASSPVTVPEGSSAGLPADTGQSGRAGEEGRPLTQKVTAPGAAWSATDRNPSGNREWEVFRLALTSDAAPDAVVESLPQGTYTWEIKGVEGRNTFWLHADYDLDPVLAGS